ncbi:MAG: hypothetical protein QM831_40085 [Kofleriaceae bacterium]
MRWIASALALVTACGTTTYEIPRYELQRLASLPPAERGQSVRVSQQLTDKDLGAPQPVTAETQIVIFPDVYVEGGYHRTYSPGWGPHASPPPGRGVGAGGGGGVNVSNTGGGGGHGGGSTGGSDGKAEAIAIIVIAATALVIAAAVEGSREDGYAQIHPMTPLYLTGMDGSKVIMPLAALDPQSAAFTDEAYFRSTETPFRFLGRAPLDRQGLTYSLFLGAGTFKSVYGTKSLGTASTIQLGYFFTQELGINFSTFMGWRGDQVGSTLFDLRYTLELDAYLAHAGPIHFGLYGGGGGASRFEDGVDGNISGLALLGGAQLQLDFNTRLALTARLGQTYAHDERMTDAMIGLAVY